MGVPVVIGAKGIEKIIEIKLNASEQKEFKASVASVRSLVNVVKKMQAQVKKGVKKGGKK